MPKKDAILRLPVRLQGAVKAATGRDKARKATDAEANGIEGEVRGHFAAFSRTEAGSPQLPKCRRGRKTKPVAGTKIQ